MNVKCVVLATGDAQFKIETRVFILFFFFCAFNYMLMNEMEVIFS